MFRFKVGSIPATVHPSHLVMSGLMGFLLADGVRGSGTWPGSALAATQGEDRTITLTLLTLGWMVLISGSMLVHELGHALVARAFGHAASMHFIGIGGRTRIERAEALTWWQEALQTAAGPGAGFALGLVAGALAWVWQRLGSAPDGARYALESLCTANLVWAVLNLVPVTTLDGGRLLAVVATRIFGRVGFLGAQVVSLTVTCALAAVAIQQGLWLLIALVVLLAVRTFASIAAYNRGELPVGEGAHPLLQRITQAEAVFREAHFADAERLAREVLAADPPPLARARAQVLLGWVSLKAGRGAQALEHFRRVEGLEVPPQALAAALSLSGADERALPIWGVAAQRDPSPVVLHELAATLLRLGRESEARRLPGVRPALAYSAAERVHYVRGEYAQAAQMAEAAFREEPSPSLAYDAACAWARAKEVTAALRMLALAAQNGFTQADTARHDPDLASLQEVPEFQRWLESVGGS